MPGSRIAELRAQLSQSAAAAGGRSERARRRPPRDAHNPFSSAGGGDCAILWQQLTDFLPTGLRCDRNVEFVRRAHRPETILPGTQLLTPRVSVVLKGLVTRELDPASVIVLARQLGDTRESQWREDG